MFVRQQYRREYGKGLPHKKPIASETDARKMKSFARLGGLKEAPASIGGEYFTQQVLTVAINEINKYSDITVSYEVSGKEVRRITELTFFIERKDDR